jgi:class 3 adenylate cyclase/tetratricopeptide (TPR) repeat protein
MNAPSDAELTNLRAALVALEAQRAMLGDAVVEVAAGALRQKITVLEQTTPPFAAPPPAPETRRLISILFMDVVGSTALAEKLDPEEWRQIIARLVEAADAVIGRHHGRVTQYVDDGVVAFFGADELREDDAENAIRAALALQAEVALRFDAAGSMPVRLRIGISSGPVVVGNLGAGAHREFTATGDAMNVAARIQSEAPAGGVLISHDTYRYVRGVFEVTPRPALVLKGKTQPVLTYLVRRAKPRVFRSITRGVAGIEARTVGRADELQTLQTAYGEIAEHGGMTWVGVRGTAGVGKTRLVAEFNAWLELRDERMRLLRARAARGDERAPFALLRWMWFDRFQITDDAPLAQAEAKWVQKFFELWGRTDADAVERAHALGLLVGLPFKDSPHLIALRADPAQVKGRAFVVARELLDRIRETHAVIMELEDLQWADPSSCEWLVQMLAAAETNPAARGLMVVGTARPEQTAPAFDRLYTAAPRAFEVELAPLSAEATRELLHELLLPLGEPPAVLVDLIAGRAEGMPYYIEELVNWCCDHGIIDNTAEPWRFSPEKLETAPLPVTLQHLLLTRLAALPEPDRAALQRGAIFGRNFWTGGVRALGGEGDAAALEGLRPRGFVARQSESSFAGETEWSFHHGLLRDVTYEAVLKRDRARLHGQAAAWLETQARAAGRLDEFAGLLGDHFERAGVASTAADWLLRAADRARGRGASLEAKRAYTRALELLPRDATDRRWAALLGREAVAAVLGDPEAWLTDLKRLRELAEAAGDRRRLADVLLRQAEFYRMQGHHTEFRQTAELAVAAAHEAGDAVREVKARALLASAEARIDDNVASIQTARTALAQARTLGEPALIAFALHRAAFCHFEGHLELTAGLAFQTEQLEIDRRLGNRFAEAMGSLNLGCGYLYLGAHKSSRTALEHALTLGKSLGARRVVAYALLNLGNLMLAVGHDSTKTRALLEEACAEMTAIGDAFGRATALEVLGMTLESAGDLAGAERRLAEGATLAEQLHSAPLLHNVLAVRARVALAEARLEPARLLAARAWQHLQRRGGVGMRFASQAFASCVEVFDAAGDGQLARDAAAAGLREIAQAAAGIADPGLRRSWLEDEPHNRALIAWGERVGLAMESA